jgi:chromatin remodeling complex protein RSC6
MMKRNRQTEIKSKRKRDGVERERKTETDTEKKTKGEEGEEGKIDRRGEKGSERGKNNTYKEESENTRIVKKLTEVVGNKKMSSTAKEKEDN